MKQELYDYDIYPKVLLAGATARVTIRPLGAHAAFPARELNVTVVGLDMGGSDTFVTEAVPSGDGTLAFDFTPRSEQQYFVRVADGQRRLVQLSIYALNGDMAGRYPYMGDLHMHTCRSDGREAPDIVAANYRSYGYDFTVISDHHRYYPSLEAAGIYKDVPINMCIVPGEEIHLPGNFIHIVNFGGEFGVNGLLKSSEQCKETGEDRLKNSLRGCEEPITDEEYTAQVNAISSELTDFPRELEPYRFAYSSCVWIFRQVQKARGVCIFAHPYWICDIYQLPRALTEYMLKNQPFDAFEVLGGDNYYEHNGQQTNQYYELRAKGYNFPVVGSTDSHGSTEHNRNRAICETIAFSRANEREELVRAVKEGYTVAVDTISTEFRLVGDFRLTRYATFLMEYYFPLHDALCYEEGRLMREYCTEHSEASIKGLNYTAGRTERLIKKYFAL